MKFGARLRNRLMKPEWEEHYIEYKRLKKRLKHIVEDEEAGLMAEALNENTAFLDSLRDNVRRTATFYQSEVADTLSKTDDADAARSSALKEYQSAGGEGCMSREDMEVLVTPIVEWLARVDDLEKFRVVNETAARKIIKKHDKVTQFSDKADFEDWVAEEDPYASDKFDELSAHSKKLVQGLLTASTTLHGVITDVLTARQAPVTEAEEEEPGLLPTAFWKRCVAWMPMLKTKQGQGLVIFGVFLVAILIYEHTVIFSIKPDAIGTLFYIGIPSAFILAFANGANDAANSLGTSVGAGALSIRQALLLGAFMEALGAMTMGTLVSKTISKGVIEPESYSANPGLFAVVMLSVLLGAGMTTLLATLFGYPISATHGIIAGLFGVGLAAKSGEGIGWIKMLITVLAWIGSPLLGTICSALVYFIIQKAILLTDDPKGNSEKWQPIFVGIVIGVASLFILLKGPKEVKIGSGSTSIWAGILVSICIGVFFAIAAYVYRKITRKRGAKQGIAPDNSNNGNELETRVVYSDPNGPVPPLTAVAPGPNSNTPAPAPVNETGRGRARSEAEKVEYEKKLREAEAIQGAERPFVSLLIVSALTVAFAHGSNDVGNAVGPLAGILEVHLDDAVTGKPDIPLWALGLGAIGFVIGILLLGTRTINTVGKKITTLTPTRSFATQIGAAIAVLSSSALALPVSTSHALVGATIGISLAQKWTGDKNAKIDAKVLKKIVIGWIVTIPSAMVVALLVYVMIFSEFKH